MYNFSKEACTLKTLLILFELSYLSRFIWDEYFDDALFFRNYFTYCMGFDASLYIDVLPFIGLLLFHYKNFKQSNHEPAY